MLNRPVGTLRRGWEPAHDAVAGQPGWVRTRATDLLSARIPVAAAGAARRPAVLTPGREAHRRTIQPALRRGPWPSQLAAGRSRARPVGPAAPDWCIHLLGVAVRPAVAAARSAGIHRGLGSPREIPLRRHRSL